MRPTTLRTIRRSLRAVGVTLTCALAAYSFGVVAATFWDFELGYWVSRSAFGASIFALVYPFVVISE